MTSLALRYLSDVARHLHLASTDKDEILTESDIASKTLPGN